ncbi:MAG: PIN domain-containing protein [Candidatus Aenigmarchaeota archaeon]|nr:PIN domain-containing protein [Candidatus Aenigmarchaeota archaeon]
MIYCADTWFTLKFFEKDEGAKALIRDIMEGKHKIVFPMVTAAESYKKLQQKGIPKHEINNFFDSAESSSHMFIHMPDRGTAAEAAQLALTFGTPMIDAFVAATCSISKCDFLLTGDEKHFHRLARKRYINVKNW